MYGTTYVEARGALERGETSCKELVSSFLQRIEERNVALNAFIRVDDAQALARARELDVEWGLGTRRPLTGMVVGIKDVICRKDFPVTCCSRILEGFTSLYSATAVERLEEAGAIIIGSTNCDEFAMGSSNESSCYGPVRHPLFPDRVPGGSSGGSAAAVAAGLCHTALGSDTGGSIRQPAAFCGVVGLKPTYGRVSRHGLVAYASSFDSIGPFARSVEDAALVLNTLSGLDPRDGTSVASSPIAFGPDSGSSLRGLRVGLPKEYLGDGLEDGIRNAVYAAARALEEAGAEVVDVELPRTEYGIAAYYVLVTAEASSNLARYDGVRYGARRESGGAAVSGHPSAGPAGVGERGHQSLPAGDQGDSPLTAMYENTRSYGFGDEVKRRIMLGTYVLSSGYYEAYFEKAARVRRLIREDFDTAFGQVDVLLTPTTPTTAFRLGEKMADPMQMYLSDIFTVTSNLAGIPGMSLPYGVDEHALPIGIQLLGAPFSEEVLLRVGHVLESGRSA